MLKPILSYACLLKKKKMLEKSGFSKITHMIVAMYIFYHLCIETLVGHVMFLKGLIADALESSEPLHLLRLNGRVGAIPT